MKDKIVEDLKREFDVRSCIGITKYKTTLEENNSDDFLQHLKEELMDEALYIQKLQTKEEQLPKRSLQFNGEPEIDDVIAALKKAKERGYIHFKPFIVNSQEYPFESVLRMNLI